MQKSTKSFPAKLLLFGEHLIIKGGQALAIPFPKYSGQWKYSENPADQQNLQAFCQYLSDLQSKNALLAKMNVEAFENDLKEGLYFESNIPLGYGAGSSGALCAAIYDKYEATKENNSRDFLNLKKELAQLESFFHGSSSGTDPLICFLQAALLLTGKEKIEIVSPPANLNPFSIFLLDTGIPRKTAPFVNHFLECYKTASFANLCHSHFIPTTEDAIHAYLQGDAENLFEKWHEISLFQQRYFSKMIPDAFQQLWLDGLSGTSFKLKLCGAGGGGFILGMVRDWEKLEKDLDRYKLLRV